MAANLVLVGSYMVYKILNRCVSSRCHYTSEHGLELHLPDPDEADQIPDINTFLQNRGLSMRIKNQKNASQV